MKKLGIFAIAASLLVGQAQAASYRQPVIIHNNYHTIRHDDSARTMAAVAVGLGLIALVISISASENCQGQVRLARF